MPRPPLERPVGAITEIYSGTKRIDNTAEVRDQLDNSFRRLDRELRYASWVAKPGQGVSGNWYVEWATLDGCRQLMLAGDVLMLTTWAPGSTAKSSPMKLTSGVMKIEGTDPFTRYRSTDPPPPGVSSSYRLVFDQVRLYFNVKAGTVTLPFDSSFTAQNTVQNAPENTDCKGERS
jgi:hypothetical protein